MSLNSCFFTGVRFRSRSFEPVGREIFPSGFPLISRSLEVFSEERLYRFVTVARPLDSLGKFSFRKLVGRSGW